MTQGQDLENREAHPHQELPVVPPSGGQEQGVNHVIMIYIAECPYIVSFQKISIPPPHGISLEILRERGGQRQLFPRGCRGGGGLLETTFPEGDEPRTKQ